MAVTVFLVVQLAIMLVLCVAQMGVRDTLKGLAVYAAFVLFNVVGINALGRWS